MMTSYLPVRADISPLIIFTPQSDAILSWTYKSTPVKLLNPHSFNLMSRRPLPQPTSKILESNNAWHLLNSGRMGGRVLTNGANRPIIPFLSMMDAAIFFLRNRLIKFPLGPMELKG